MMDSAAPPANRPTARAGPQLGRAAGRPHVPHLRRLTARRYDVGLAVPLDGDHRHLVPCGPIILLDGKRWLSSPHGARPIMHATPPWPTVASSTNRRTMRPMPD